eukprot:12311441-Heterocapsa_arctica.AAC.1
MAMQHLLRFIGDHADGPNIVVLITAGPPGPDHGQSPREDAPEHAGSAGQIFDEFVKLFLKLLPEL